MCTLYNFILLHLNLILLIQYQNNDFNYLTQDIIIERY